MARSLAVTTHPSAIINVDGLSEPMHDAIIKNAPPASRQNGIQAPVMQSRAPLRRLLISRATFVGTMLVSACFDIAK